MSASTCSNANPRGSTRSVVSAQYMNASSGSGLWPTLICIEAVTVAHPPRRRRSNPPLPTARERRADRMRTMAFRDLFSFLFQRSTQEERVAQYVIREHDRGRSLNDILEDKYVVNRLTSPE